jgi:heme iron utilization protein
MTPTNSQIDTIRAALNANPGAVLEDLAKEHGVTTKDVLALLPDTESVLVGGDRFELVMREMTTWGELTLVVNTGDVILEAKGRLPEGSMAQGYYNLHGKPIGGHLKASNCDLIAFVSRKLFSSDTHSVQFYNRLGDCMFKVYLGRDAQRQLIPEQVERFKAFRDGLTGSRLSAQ